MKTFTIFIFLMTLTAANFAQNPPAIEPGVSQTLAKWRAANYSDVRYKLNLTLEKGAPTLKGTIEIRVKLSEPPALAGGSTPQIILDWRKIRGKEDLSKVSNVSINGKPAKFEEINEHLVFKEGVQKGENTISLDFTSPIATSGAAVTRYVDKEDGAEYVYSLFVPSDASTAFPVFDQPDLKARFKLLVATPLGLGWSVVSNTKSESFILETSKIVNHFFEETKPISTYVFAFAAGDFENLIDLTNISNNGTVHGIINGVFVRRSQAEKFRQHAPEVFRLNREAVKYLESYFDYKFPFPKYDLVLIPEFPFGGMEHAGATFLREDRIIFPTEPTKNDHITRANLIFHEAAHQWFGNTVTMKWFDDLWLKEGFAEFMAYKTMEKVLPEYNAWKAFYERNKPLAYLTDATQGTTPIYQEIPNLSAAKSAYGNIVYRKAPSFLKQAEFYLGEKEFQTAVRSFLKKHEFANAEWTDLVKEFEDAAWFSSMAFYHPYEAENVTKEAEERQRKYIRDWANSWVKQPGLPTIKVIANKGKDVLYDNSDALSFEIKEIGSENPRWKQDLKIYVQIGKNPPKIFNRSIPPGWREAQTLSPVIFHKVPQNADVLIFPNYQDYGYGIFLLDEKSRDYVLKNIQNEKDDFLRSMMWGTLWDSVRFYELAPEEYVKLAIKNVGSETDELTISTILARVSTAMSYYIEPVPPTPISDLGFGNSDLHLAKNQSKIQNPKSKIESSANADGSDRSKLAPQIENLLIDKMRNAPTLGQRITYYRAFVNLASTDNGKQILKDILSGKFKIQNLELKTKDKFDIVTKLIILGDKDALNLLAELEKTATDDAAKRYAYAARAGIPTAENKAKFWNDFTNNKDISESWIESAFVVFNSPRHAELTLPYLEKGLAELPNLKRNRKIFFVNGWLAAFIGGQKSAEALKIVNKFLADNPNLDRDLRLKILENVDGLERSVKIRGKFPS